MSWSSSYLWAQFGHKLTPGRQHVCLQLHGNVRMALLLEHDEARSDRILMVAVKHCGTSSAAQQDASPPMLTRAVYMREVHGHMHETTDSAHIGPRMYAHRGIGTYIHTYMHAYVYMLWLLWCVVIKCIFYRPAASTVSALVDAWLKLKVRCSPRRVWTHMHSICMHM